MKKYYIGINANNAICNESFFDGSITLYPTGEKGNIYYTAEHVNKSEMFLNNIYKEYLLQTIKRIQKEYDNDVSFMIINEKVNAMCDGIKANFVTNVNTPIYRELNNKHATREILNGKVPMLEYSWFDNKKRLLQYLAKKKSQLMVLQKSTGSGGDGTYLLKTMTELNTILKTEKLDCCISNYVENIPLNVTVIISQNKSIQLPVSAQLISLEDGKFKYVGGDFVYPINLDADILMRLYEYTNIIVDELKKYGYLGIVGIDYVLTKDKELKFMEINPRFQSSSFLLSQELDKYNNTNIGKLHYQALSNESLDAVTILHISKSFLNCNWYNQYSFIKDEEQIIFNGYYEKNETSIYRKIFNRSILNEGNFENIH